MVERKYGCVKIVQKNGRFSEELFQRSEDPVRLVRRK
jgi:hypothetical protein